MADKVWRRSQTGHKAGHKADTGRDMADMADKVWRRGQSGLKANTRADIWRTQGGHMADKVEAGTRRTRGGHMADTWRTTSGDAARAYRGQPFFLRENPTVNCLGKNEKLIRLRRLPSGQSPWMEVVLSE